VENTKAWFKSIEGTRQIIFVTSGKEEAILKIYFKVGKKKKKSNCLIKT